MKKLLGASLCIWGICVVQTAIAQEKRSLTGSVKDAQGTTLLGVTVGIKNTSIGTVTSADGKFHLNISDKDTLVLSFVGFNKKEVAVNKQGDMKIILEATATSLNETVVVGYGVQKKVNLSGAVTSVNFDKTMQSRPVTDLSTALSGMAPGVSVSQASGQPGRENATIRIRGVGTLNNADPFILVDGIESSMSDVNMADVESISVLKDAAAAAIYGSRAANGVVLISTKKGKKGKTTVSYNGYYGVQKATRLFNPVSDYATYMQLMNRVAVADNPSNTLPFKQATIDSWKNATDRTLYPNTDWMGVLFGQGKMTGHTVSVSGGSDKTTYYMSLDYLHNEGIMKNTSQDRYMMRLNADHEISKKIKVGANIALTWKERREPQDVGTILTNAASTTPGITPKITDANGTRYGGRNTDDENGQLDNPLQYIETWNRPNRQQRTFAKVYGEWSIIDGLKFQVNGAADYFNVAQKSYALAGAIQNRWNFQKNIVAQQLDQQPASLAQMDSTNLHLTYFATLNYTKNLGTDHHFNVLAGMSSESVRGTLMTASVQNFPTNNTWELGAGLEQPKVGGTSDIYKIISYFGRVNYDYKNKYLLEANLRRDGSSKFRSGLQYGVYPSFSAAWRLLEEPFIKDVIPAWVNNVKVRASWGKLGNDRIPLYSFMDLYSAGQNYSYGGSIAAGLTPLTMANQNITWEKTTSSNLGVDANLFNDHFNVTFDVFNRHTSDILVKLGLSSLYGGLTPPYQNVGIVDNKGWELSMGYNNSAGDFRYGISGNVSNINNKVVKFQGNAIGTLSGASVIKEGWSIGSLYGLQVAGIFQNDADVAAWAKQRTAGTNKPGDFKFVDMNNDKVVDGADRINMGNTIPNWYFGLNLNAGYKGFDLALLFQGVGGVKRYYQDNWYTSGIRAGREINADFQNAWTPDNPNTNMPRLTAAANTDNTQANTFWVQNASFVRLKNIQLSYTIPKKVFRSTLQSIRVYVNAQNAFTWTKFKGLDPEVSDYTQPGIQYPNVRVITGGVNVIF
ncbi:TonB-linked SusC/RagA family outer membrane protein [Chitinophaga niastensis]|uniref:TonB-linked SusC/RagA family outer membrane protein n=1 Tax=Chitinophaga niastensis TaxID=536980 RepID=A0A2P8HVR1_CHINA|nr:TonB-dependent receptor [Chitinophaga niastensis]PSL50254.1 TonB-linked SusC/RagA family outer membrane protein [Chitinophaga niastensis]